MTDFDKAVGGDQRLMARFDAIAEKLTADLAAEGITLNDIGILKSMPGVKLAVFTDMGLPGDILSEVKRHPALADQIKSQEVQRQLAAGDSAAHTSLAALSRVQRMEIGRRLEAERAAEKAATTGGLSAEEEGRTIAWLRKIKSPAERLSVARAAGLC